MEPTRARRSPRLSPQSRALVADHHHLVENVARSISRFASDDRRLDLQAAGEDGLIRAALRFDPSRGTPFRAFAIAQIRWTMLNRLREERRARRELAHDFESASASQPSALRCELTGRPCERQGVEDVLVERVEAARRRALVEALLSQLKRAEREIVEAHYFEDRELKELVASSRSYVTVRRRHHDALRKLGQRLRAHEARLH